MGRGIYRPGHRPWPRPPVAAKLRRSEKIRPKLSIKLRHSGLRRSSELLLTIQGLFYTEALSRIRGTFFPGGGLLILFIIVEPGIAILGPAGNAATRRCRPAVRVSFSAIAYSVSPSAA